VYADEHQDTPSSGGLLDHERLHVVTYMNKAKPLFGYLQVSAEKHGLHPEILGYGDVAWWPDGLGVKINQLRQYVMQDMADNELVLFLDAFDVMLYAGREEIVRSFERLEKHHQKHIFFNAEAYCFPEFEDTCGGDYPQSPHTMWRYLNSGAIIGRVGAFRHILKDPVDNIIPGSDQAWYQRYFRQHPEEVGLDYECVLLCSTQGMGGHFGMEIEDGRLHNVVTKTVPAVVHFVSSAHWAKWIHGRPTTVLQQVFEELHPEKATRLFGSIDISMNIGGSHSSGFRLEGSRMETYHSVMHTVLCLTCRFWDDSDRECEYASSLTSDMCTEVRWGFVFSILTGLITFFLVRRRGRIPGNRASKCRVDSPGHDSKNV